MVDLTRSRSKCNTSSCGNDATEGDELDGLVDDLIDPSLSQSDDDVQQPLNSPSTSSPYLFFFLLQLYLLFSILSGLFFLFSEYVIIAVSEYLFSFSSDYIVYSMKVLAIFLFALLGHSSWFSFKDEEVELLSVFQHYLLSNRYPPTDFLYHLLYFYALPHMFLSVGVGFILAIFFDFRSFIFLTFCSLIALVPLRYIRRKII